MIRLLLLTLVACVLGAPTAAQAVEIEAFNLALGDRPEAVAALGARSVVYVANRGANTIAVLDARARTLTRTISRPAGGVPVALAASNLRGRLYDLDSSGRLYIRSSTTGDRIATVELPRSYAVSSGRSTRTVGLTPRDVAVHQGRNRIYVVMSAFPGDGRLVVVGGESREVLEQIPLGNQPRAVAVTQGRVYVSNSGSDTVSVINVATNAVVQTFAVGDQPHGLDVVENRLIVANRGGGSVSIANIVSGRLVDAGKAAVGDEPVGVAAERAHEFRHRVWVTSKAGGTVSLLEVDRDGRLVEVERRAVAGGPHGVAVDPRSHRAVVTRPGSDRAAFLARFDPVLHGFRFDNTFSTQFVTPILRSPSFVTAPVDVTKVPFALCGGIAWAALDTFNLGLRRPNTNDAQVESGPVFDYISSRLLETLTTNNGSNLARFLDWQSKFDGDLSILTAPELVAIRTQLDLGKPVPIGLIHVGPIVGLPWENHQSLAVGHFTTDDGELVLELYDPNYPEKLTFIFTEQRKLTHNRAGTLPVRRPSLFGPQDVVVRGIFSTLSTYTTRTPPW